MSIEPPTAASDHVPSTFDDGELFDTLFKDFDYGLDFYVNLAKQARGPVLDIGCGTGRILLRCLADGVDIEGLDLYDGMLDRLRKSADAKGLRPRLHKADMSDFTIDRRFALIMIPFNAFVHNMTADAQIGCLERCRRHLLPGGMFVFDGFFPAREYIMAPDGVRVLEGEFTHPETGLPVRMYDTRSFDRVHQIQHSFNEIEFLDRDGNVTKTHPSRVSLRWVYKHEMELLLRLAGFKRWQICGGFDRRPLVNETDMMLVFGWNDEGTHQPDAQARGGEPI
jgi:SAM-dependent methyltransferase